MTQAMAKREMICPFSGRLCEECPLYRGRHYFMCFCDRYRGHLNDTAGNGGTDKPLAAGLWSAEIFEFPGIKPRSAIDPFVMTEIDSKED
jgi:hypothetical protein